MNIHIDVREHELIEQIKKTISNTLTYQHLNVIIETLPLGDAIIEMNGLEKVIIERKSIHDLAASIKDGRYEEQSYRLSGCEIHNHNIFYVIEGDLKYINKFRQRMDEKTLYSAIFSLSYYKGFSVIRTFTLEETSMFLCNTANKIRKCELEGKRPYYSNNIGTNKTTSDTTRDTTSDIHSVTTSLTTTPLINDEINIPYVNVIKKVKKENITPENIGEIMLCQIPGISSVTAIAVMAHFKTIANLIKQVEEHGEQCLKDVAYITSKEQSRKLNKTCITNIIRFLGKSNF